MAQRSIAARNTLHYMYSCTYIAISFCSIYVCTFFLSKIYYVFWGSSSLLMAHPIQLYFIFYEQNNKKKQRKYRAREKMCVSKTKIQKKRFYCFRISFQIIMIIVIVIVFMYVVFFSPFFLQGFYITIELVCMNEKKNYQTSG